LDSHGDIFSFSGTYGNTFSNLAVANADLLIVLGARLSLMQVGKFKEKYTRGRIIHVDIDRNEFGRALPEHLSIYADLKPFFEELNQRLDNESLPAFSQWRSQVTEWSRRFAHNAEINKEGLDPVKVVRVLSAHFAPDAIITGDVGQNQMWVAQALTLASDQRLLNSGGHGAMGFSLPAAIGAKFAAPNAQVIALMGDGGFQMNVQELMLIAQRRLNIKCIVLNNNTIGMIKDLQRYFKLPFHGTSDRYYSCPDLQMLAGAYGLKYLAITDEAHLAQAAEALAEDMPYLMDVRISPNSVLFNIYHDTKILEENGLGD
jgi:acetolactate synthase-1/2/3 large subunit